MWLLLDRMSLGFRGGFELSLKDEHLCEMGERCVCGRFGREQSEPDPLGSNRANCSRLLGTLSILQLKLRARVYCLCK